MTGETRKHWMEFCAQAAIEQDPNKLILLAEEINRLLQEKQDRLNGGKTSSISEAAGIPAVNVSFACESRQYSARSRPRSTQR